MVDELFDQRCDLALERTQQRQAGAGEAVERVERAPEAIEPAPLGVWIERVPHRAAQLHADPSGGVWIVGVRSKYERTRQADQAHEADRGGDPDAADRPEVGE